VIARRQAVVGTRSQPIAGTSALRNSLDEQEERARDRCGRPLALAEQRRRRSIRRYRPPTQAATISRSPAPPQATGSGHRQPRRHRQRRPPSRATPGPVPSSERIGSSRQHPAVLAGSQLAVASMQKSWQCPGRVCNHESAATSGGGASTGRTAARGRRRQEAEAAGWWPVRRRSRCRRPTEARHLLSAQGRAGGAERTMPANTRAGQDQIRSCAGTTADLRHTNQLSMRFASAPGTAVLAAAATGSSSSQRAPTLSAMLASVPPPASARGATQASSRRLPRAF
jgi:hypothetical protein